MANRCSWVPDGDELYAAYHDDEWGVPIHDDRLLFEFICLEGAQAGLSWNTILKKRENYRRIFDHFDAAKLARWTDTKLEKTLKDPGIVRNRLKVFGVRKNAQAFLKVVDEFGSFDTYIWSFVDGEVIQNQWKNLKEVPATTAESDRMSKDMKKRGFTFVGSTICYAFMQAAGLVNDHTVDCPRWRALGGA
ncbi:DNA-3-methyladenine glycosylase I [Rubellicoccus peritrichatus]|uniref:DNA-3-methyladenine glycosylase I n=1 Tax=Rubellicoccus peritrichatus TaxID=3080537 RepID=A0AAQ3LCD6_9BACT|nr:DNA-3-methyladenine glycosylase I [Puniceicoccus sp. CR14]WOO41290.1 DNA-3-methyladenine glycosylase I [Puniceicoccus sp. CR14]